jgi:hypothetical protein
MAIYRLIANGSFGPEETKAMTAAYEAALLDLRLADRDDPITEIVARAIVGVASTGERDPVTLKDRALHAIRAGQPDTEARDTGAFKARTVRIIGSSSRRRRGR